MLDVYSWRRRWRLIPLLLLLLVAAAPPSTPVGATTAQPSAPASSPAAAKPDVTPLGPGEPSVAKLPKGKSACPSAPGKQNGPGAACSDTAPPPSNDRGTVHLPKGQAPCGAVNGKSSSPESACSTQAVSAGAPATNGKVSLPAGATPCGTYKGKQSSATAACSGGASSTPPAALSGMREISIGPSTSLRTLDPSWSVSLYTSDTYIGVNHSVTLTAYTNQDVGPSPYWTSIFDASTGALLNYCGYGTSCSASYTLYSAGYQGFVAYVANYPSSSPPSGIAAVSGTVYTTWITITGLSTSPQYLRPNTATTITVYSSVDVGPTPYYLEIFDGSTGANVAICGAGTSCSGSYTLYGAGVHYFTGYISLYGTSNAPPSVQSSTNVNAYWMSVTISSSSVALSPGQSVHLTATSNADVGPSPYYISIFDTTTNTRVALCAAGSSCSTDYWFNASTIKDFFAYIGSNSASAPPQPVLVSSNNHVEITWLTVGLQISPQLVSPNQAVNLSATSSISLNGSNYAIALYDTSSGWITACWNASSCSTSVVQASPTVHNFIAYIDTGGQANPPAQVQAQSAIGSAGWISVAVRACNYPVSQCPSNSTTNGTVVNGPLTLTAATQVDVSTYGYAIQILDPTGNVKSTCTSGLQCSATVTEAAAGNGYIFSAQVETPIALNAVNVAASGQAPSLKWVTAKRPWNKDSSSSGFSASSQWDYSDDPTGSQAEYGIDEGLPTLTCGSRVYAPEAGTLSYQPSSVWWEPGRAVLLLDSGGFVGIGHVNIDPNVTPGHVAAGTLIAEVAQNPAGSCSNSHVEFMYSPTVPANDRNITSFRPPSPTSQTAGCPRHPYNSTVGAINGTSVDPCAWLSAYLLYGS